MVQRNGQEDRDRCDSHASADGNYHGKSLIAGTGRLTACLRKCPAAESSLVSPITRESRTAGHVPLRRGRWASERSCIPRCLAHRSAGGNATAVPAAELIYPVVAVRRTHALRAVFAHALCPRGCPWRGNRFARLAANIPVPRSGRNRSAGKQGCPTAGHRLRLRRSA